MELYSDLPLLSRDVLSSALLFEDLADCDDLNTDFFKVTDTEVFDPSKDDIETLVSNLGSLEPIEEDVHPWMEDKVNLLDLLMNDEHILPDEDLFPSSLDISIQPDEAGVPGDIAILSQPQHNLGNITFSTPTQKDVENLLFSSDSQQVFPPTAGAMDTSIVMDSSINMAASITSGVSFIDKSVSMDTSMSCIEDSGIDLSICDTDQSLLELLKQQMIVNMDDPSSIPLLQMNVDDAVDNVSQSFFPISIMEEGGDPAKNVSVTFAPPTSSLGESQDGEPSSPLSYVSVDMHDTSSPQDSLELLSSDEESSVDFDQYSSLLKKNASSTNQIRDKKLRKMKQNKHAATRYRVKKKLEGGAMETECQMLEKRNTELRDKVETITREITYLKELMADVYQAKLAAKASKHT